MISTLPTEPHPRIAPGAPAPSPAPDESLEAPTRARPRDALRLLSDPLAPRESRGRRATGWLFAIVLLLGFAYVLASFWAPAHPGVDQNGYLVGGKMLARSFSTAFVPREPYEFVGWMWIRTDDGAYHPKYPVGLPLLNAIALWLDPVDGDPRGKTWALMISPTCTILALGAMFLLARAVAGSFLGVLGMILLGTGMTTLAVANSPWSHAPALCFVTWGMYLLVRFWQTGSTWRGILAGLLLGYAVTIRYTEGLLVLPMALVSLSMLRWRAPRTYVRAGIPLLAWLVPVGLLVLYNWTHLGAITGYDTTNESTGFTLENFRAKWQFMVQQIYDHGAFFTAPLAVFGLVLIYRASWRIGLLLTLWFVPATLLYAAYYWGMNNQGIGYLRFFLTLLPPLIAAACCTLRSGGWSDDPALREHDGRRRRMPIAAPLACGAIVAIAAGMSLRSALATLARDHAVNRNLAYTVDQIARAVPGGSVLLVAQEQRGPGNQMLNFLQFAGDYELYSSEAFTSRGIGPRGGGGRGLSNPEPDQPAPLQAARRQYLQQNVYNDKSDDDLLDEQRRILRQAIVDGRGAFALVAADGIGSLKNRLGKRFAVSVVTSWKEPAAVPEVDRPLIGPGAGPAPPAPPPPGGPPQGDFRGRRAPNQPPRGAPQRWQVVRITSR